jgi:hypothetical protein
MSGSHGGVGRVRAGSQCDLTPRDSRSRISNRSESTCCPKRLRVALLVKRRRRRVEEQLGGKVPSTTCTNRAQGLRSRKVSPKVSKRSCMGLPAALIVPASRTALPPKAASDGDNVRLHVLTDGDLGSVGARARPGCLGGGRGPWWPWWPWWRGAWGHARRGPWAVRIGPLGGSLRNADNCQSKRESANQHQSSHYPKGIELESPKRSISP